MIKNTRIAIRCVPALSLIALLAANSSAALLRAQDAAAPVEEEKPRWKSSAAAGLTLTRGNSDTLLVTANLQSQRKVDLYEIRLGLDASYGENDNIKATESARAYGQYDRLFGERFYGGLRLEVLHDDIADVDYRATIGPLAGYYFIKKEKTLLSGELGPAFIYEKQGDDEGGYFTLRLGERFEHEFSDQARVWQSVEFLPQVDDFDNYLIIAEVGAEAALTESLSLRTYIQNKYDNQPAPGRKGNDVKVVAQLAYKF